MQKTAIVLLAEGFEEIEAVTIIDVLRRSGVLVDACGINTIKVQGSRGISISTDLILKDANNRYDALALPGGLAGSKNLVADKRVKEMLIQAKALNKLIAAICASSALVLAPLGILDGRSATCYPGMENNFSKTTKYVNDHVVVDGNIITGSGPAAALKFALALVNSLCGKSVSDKTAGGLLI
ncbi:MAG: DJ-1/PfpI family protein [Candidatus Omnitrophica bacterium]|jgi:4-methyl-5(b-hydroxyethyl)-thiazole monophosphate biosynthesis|nr:DJ-1/PfpI family protein [Candidatus Omnitrophota bacterium]